MPTQTVSDELGGVIPFGAWLHPHEISFQKEKNFPLEILVDINFLKEKKLAFDKDWVPVHLQEGISQSNFIYIHDANSLENNAFPPVLVPYKPLKSLEEIENMKTAMTQESTGDRFQYENPIIRMDGQLHWEFDTSSLPEREKLATVFFKLTAATFISCEFFYKQEKIFT